jgi:hypothetical protein
VPAGLLVSYKFEVELNAQLREPRAELRHQTEAADLRRVNVTATRI